MDNPTLVDEREVSRRLGIAVATLRRWRWVGCGPAFVKLGTSVRYSLTEIEDYIRRNTRQSTSDTHTD